MRIDIITITPEAFDSYLNTSILARAQARGIIDINIHNPRDLTTDPHHTVDDRPYGGGAGMVLMAEPILQAFQNILKNSRRIKKRKVVILSAKGKQFNQKMAHDWSRRHKQIIFISGRYEGIDERVRLILKAEEVSIGPYVLTDGDVAAMVAISAVTRLLPGAIKFESLQEESFLGDLSVDGKLVEYPHYTRPEVLIWKGKKYRVPKVLLSGNHAKIKHFRHERALSATKKKGYGRKV